MASISYIYACVHVVDDEIASEHICETLKARVATPAHSDVIKMSRYYVIQTICTCL